MGEYDIKLVVVDADSMSTYLLGKYVNHVGDELSIKVEFIPFHNIDDAFNYLTKYVPNILFIDPTDPSNFTSSNKTGWDMLDKLPDGIIPPCKAYIFTSYEYGHDYVRAETHDKITGCVLKPLDVDVLTKIIKDCQSV